MNTGHENLAAGPKIIMSMAETAAFENSVSITIFTNIKINGCVTFIIIFN